MSRKLPIEIKKQHERDSARRYYLANKTKLDAYRRKWAKDNSVLEKKYKTTWLKKNLAWYYAWEQARHPAIRKAYWTVQNALRKGSLKRLPCDVCGSLPSHAHHKDYSKPLDIRWLCPKHHKTIHTMTKKQIVTAQQGDLLLRKLGAMPSGKTKMISSKRCVLAHGEHGHSHVIEEDEAELIEMGERILLSITQAATIVHPEHGPVEIPAGVWEIGKVQEYDWFSQMKRDVID